jgi:hypothetical protein
MAMSVVIGIVYHPQRVDDSIATSHIIDNLNCMTLQHPGAGIVLLGDFNQLPIFRYNYLTVSSKTSSASSSSYNVM